MRWDHQIYCVGTSHGKSAWDCIWFSLTHFQSHTEVNFITQEGEGSPNLVCTKKLYGRRVFRSLTYFYFSIGRLSFSNPKGYRPDIYVRVGSCCIFQKYSSCGARVRFHLPFIYCCQGTIFSVFSSLFLSLSKLP